MQYYNDILVRLSFGLSDLKHVILNHKISDYCYLCDEISHSYLESLLIYIINKYKSAMISTQSHKIIIVIILIYTQSVYTYIITTLLTTI